MIIWSVIHLKALDNLIQGYLSTFYIMIEWNNLLGSPIVHLVLEHQESYWLVLMLWHQDLLLAIFQKLHPEKLTSIYQQAFLFVFSFVLLNPRLVMLTKLHAIYNQIENKNLEHHCQPAFLLLLEVYLFSTSEWKV